MSGKRRTWEPFCRSRDCRCFVPTGFVCDEFVEAEHWRCGHCGWPASVHMVRDRMAEAGLRLVIGAERVEPTA